VEKYRQITFGIAFLLCALLLPGTRGADRYVSLDGTNDFANQFTDWSGAATQIQWAVNVAANGETVWVSNGTYYLTNQISITNGIILKSLSGSWTNTIINGNYPVATNRCFNMNNTGLVVEGFTLTNGCAPYVVAVTSGQNGGGAYISAGTLRNCLVTGNQVTNTGVGGGIYAIGINSMITNCDIIGNVMFRGGAAGAYLYTHAQLGNCRIMYNWTSNTNLSGGAGYGGGLSVYYSTNTVICNSLIISNRLGGKNNPEYGGGVYLYQGGTLRNCLVMGNFSWLGAGVCAHSGSAAIYNNIDNCTIVSNYATSSCGGIGSPYAGGNSNRAVQVNNTICYSNRNGEVGWAFLGNAVFSNCLVPYTGILPGSGNLTNKNPAFVNFTGGDFRLTTESPCINAGFNLPWMDAVDLDGFARMDRFSGLVDIGCYENHPRGLMFKAR
jgi:hypothetical protein